MSAATEQSHPVKSGAAGAATFPGSDSRKFNYFEPKGRKATHYEDMTVDVQPDPERYLLQDWIISFPDGTPTYSKNWTKALRARIGIKFRAVDQEWERTHYQRQSTICGMVQGVDRKRPQVRRAEALRQGLGEDPAGSSGRLEACRVWPRHIDDAGAALRLYPDDQHRDPDQFLLQAALRPGHHALSRRDRPRHRRVSTRTPARNIGSKIRSGRERASRSNRSWARQTISSNISPPMSFSSRWSANCSAAASSCRRRRRRTISSRRPSYRRQRPTMSATSPIPSN